MSASDLAELERAIEALYDDPSTPSSPEAEAVFQELRRRLREGSVRAAEPVEGGWKAHAWVKKGILLGFRLGRLERVSGRSSSSHFYDKHTVPLRPLALEDGVRLVPGGSSIRDGAYVAPGVVCMPPMYVNIGAYVDEGTMIDSHALVGSCAQIGKRVHLSAAVQIGGVLEPVGAMPVIVEDDVLVGGNCGVYEGTLVGREAVLAPGTLLTRSTPVYDLVAGAVLRGRAEAPLRIPPRAVVVPGSRPARGAFAEREGLQTYAAIIVKYRDRGTDAAVALEDALRS